jgi:hypothetical protein
MREDWITADRLAAFSEAVFGINLTIMRSSRRCGDYTRKQWLFAVEDFDVNPLWHYAKSCQRFFHVCYEAMSRGSFTCPHLLIRNTTTLSGFSVRKGGYIKQSPRPSLRVLSNGGKLRGSGTERGNSPQSARFKECHRRPSSGLRENRLCLIGR